MRCFSAVVLALALAGCVPYPEGAAPPEPPPQPASGPQGPFPALDPGGAQLDSLHFVVRAYGSDTARQIAEQAEEAYRRIMVDTNLFSFQPRMAYQIVVYGSPDEYHKKTAQPSWSGGVTVGSSIYTFYGPNLMRTVSHEMTHLIFFEYMGRADISQRWVNEGLAVYEEEKAAGALQGGQADFFGAVRPALRQQPIPMDQMITLVPATENQASVSLWYAEAESLTRFMIDRGGQMAYAQFLAALHEGKPYDQAVAAGFPGAWSSLADVYQAWVRNLQ